MSHPSTRVLVGCLVAGLLLAACSSDPDPVVSGPSDVTSASASADPSAGISPSPSSTLTAEEQQAFEEATAVVLAYRQTITDLYSGARTNLNDLNAVATGEKAEADLADIQRGLGDGWRYEPMGGQVVLVAADPVAINLTDAPNEVVVRACVDTTAITDISPSGSRTPGIREELDYTLVRTTHLPAPSWAVTRVATDITDSADRRC